MTAKNETGNGLAPTEQDVLIKATAKNELLANVKIGRLNSFDMKAVVDAIEDFLANWSSSYKWSFGHSSVNIYGEYVSFYVTLPKENVWIDGVPFKE